MIILTAIIVCCVLAYSGMTAGVYPMLSRVLMGAIAVTAGAGFGGYLYDVTGSDNKPYIHGACMLTIAVVVYALQRGLAGFCLSERRIALPEIVDRLGGVFAGFLAGLILCGFAALVIVTVQPLGWMPQDLYGEFHKLADVGSGTVSVVGMKWIATADITRERATPHVPATEETETEDRSGTPTRPGGRPESDRRPSARYSSHADSSTGARIAAGCSAGSPTKAGSF